MSESDGDAHLGEKGTGIVDNPDPGYEKVEVEETSCDDGLGPDPNILERNDKHTNSGDNTSPEFNPETKLERIVRKTVQKYFFRILELECDMTQLRNYLILSL